MGRDLIEDLKGEVTCDVLNTIIDILDDAKDVMVSYLYDRDASEVDIACAKHFVDEYRSTIFDMIIDDFDIEVEECDEDCDECPHCDLDDIDEKCYKIPNFLDV